MNDTHTKSQHGEKRTVTVAPAVRRKHSTPAGSTTVAPTTHRTVAPGSVRAAVPTPSTGSRTRSRAITASVAVVLAVAAWFFLRQPRAVAPPTAEPVAVFEIVQGAVEVIADATRPTSSRLLSLEAAEPIHAGTVIETRSAHQPAAPGRTTVAGAASGAASGAAGRAAFRLADGASVRLDTDTRVQVASNSVLTLERGAVYIDAAEAGAAVEVRTTLGVVRDIGTQFEVRLLSAADPEGSLRVRIREGAVVLRRDGESHEAGAGAELSMGGDGTLTRGSSPIYGPDWDWVLEAAPAFEIEGRPLSEFLDWVTREGGWTLRFADQKTEDEAPGITLYGDVRGLTPEEGAAVVLKGSDLEYQLKDGTFWVGPAGFQPAQP